MPRASPGPLCVYVVRARVCVSGRTVRETGVGDLGIRRGGVDHTRVGLLLVLQAALGSPSSVWERLCQYLSRHVCTCPLSSPRLKAYSLQQGPSVGWCNCSVLFVYPQPFSLSPPALSAPSPFLPAPFLTGNEACLGPAHSHQQFQRYRK